MLRKLFIAAALALLSACLSGCMTTSGVVANDVPPCDRLIPPSVLEPTPGADLPQARKLPDGHDDAQPWQAGFVEQTGQLEIANTKPGAVDHIYRECLRQHAERLAKDTRGFLARLFGGS